MGRLQQFRDHNGSVLDNTIVLFGSGASTTYNPTDLPALIAGGANLGLKHGTHWRKPNTRMSNLYLSILRSLKIEENSFSDSTGVIQDSIFSAVWDSHTNPKRQRGSQDPDFEEAFRAVAGHYISKKLNLVKQATP